jgi:adenylosuccinate lyase
MIPGTRVLARVGRAGLPFGVGRELRYEEGEELRRVDPREDAYAIVQPLAMRVWDDGANFHDLVMNDKRVADKLSREELDELFDVNKQLRNVDKIFNRVFE